MKIDARDIFHMFIVYMYMQVLLVTEFLQPSFALLMKGRKKRAGGVEEGISDRAYSKFSSNVTCQCSDFPWPPKGELELRQGSRTQSARKGRKETQRKQSRSLSRRGCFHGLGRGNG